MRLSRGCMLLASAVFLQTAAALPKWVPTLVRRDPPAPEETKYFHEPGGDDIMGHYDTRFFNGVVSYEERTDTLTHMIKAYLLFFGEKGLETWIAHGTLLGWWWNGKMLPWDWDVDTQVNTETLFDLADNYNQTIYNYTSPDGDTKRKYLLDVNPFARYRYRGQGLNIIDARWIDIRNGLYIDITGVSELYPDTEPGILQCKNHHKYKPSDLYPMRMSTYEGVPAKIPYKYHDLLVKEYGRSSMTVLEFEDHNWVPHLKEWVPDMEKIEAKARQAEEDRAKKKEEEAKKQLKARANQYH